MLRQTGSPCFLASAHVGQVHNAAALVLFNNHPSGNPEPSAADRAITVRLKQALALLDIRVLDHLVLGGNVYTSLAARGWV